MPDLKELTRMINEHYFSLRYFIQGLGVNPAWVDDVARDAFLRPCLDDHSWGTPGALRIAPGGVIPWPLS